MGAVPVPDLFSQKLDGVAWRSKSSWYIVATEDRTVHPELERSAAKRMGASTGKGERRGYNKPSDFPRASASVRLPTASFRNIRLM